MIGSQTTRWPLRGWHDGHVHTCSSVTLRNVLAFKAGARASGHHSSEMLFEGEHCITHHRGTFRRRPNRGLLISGFD